MKPTVNGYYWFLSEHRMANGVIVLVYGCDGNAPWVEFPGDSQTSTVASMDGGQWFGPLACPLTARAAPAGGADFDVRR